MKKQILTLTMCLALTATTVLASGTAAVAKRGPAKASSHIVKAVSKTTVKTVKKTTPVANQTVAPEVTLTPEQLAKKKFEEKMAKDRDDLYCKLGFSAEQKAKSEALDVQQRTSAEPLFTKLHTEKAKLRELKAKNASPIAICKQKAEVKAARKAVRAHMEASRKAFEALLNKDQLAKFTTLREENMKAHKASRHHHHHDGMAPQGAVPPVGPACPKCPCEGK